MNVSGKEIQLHRSKHGLMNLRGFYLFSGLIWGFLGPYMVSWFVSDGMQTKEAGLIIAVATLVALIFQPVLGVAVDRYGIGKFVLLLSVAVPAVLSLFYNSRSFLILLFAYSLATIFKNIQAPVSDSYAISMSGRFSVSYGQIRSFASFGMAFGGFLGGLFVSGFSVQRLWVPTVLLSAVCFLNVLGLSDEGKANKTSSAPFFKDVSLILKNRKFLFFLIGCLFVNQTLPAFDSYFVVTFESIGGSFSMAGVGLLLASLTNIPAMLIASRVIKRIGLEGTLILAHPSTCCAGLCR
ncbi:MFS transporter [Sporolactobacillus mangiferae]|uniref:MFS transporter n=1 Tax=Sporolactobacillus mangiferae TaxID=2940498 RepID=UPI0024B34F8C|nr:MFS transporter [Sporolactobacillus mangiferae]